MPTETDLDEKKALPSAAPAAETRRSNRPTAQKHTSTANDEGLPDDDNIIFMNCNCNVQLQLCFVSTA